MTDITIPPAALEAAAIDLHRSEWGADAYSWADLESDTRDLFRNHARAACLAMIKAWPGMKHELDWDTWLGERHTPNRIAIILPLPQKEPRDAE